jgi:hypothetical protein
MTCRLDSEVADRLQDCYGQLAKLGFKVTGLEVLRPEPERPQPLEKDAAPREAPSPALAAPVRRSAERRERHLTLEVTGTQVPGGAREGGPVLAASERLLSALKAGSDPARPADERLTFLRGSLGKGGLKIAEVGLGEGENHGPARWEDAATWMARQAEPQVAAPRRELVPE